MSDTPNTDKLQELVESGALDMPKAKQDTTKVKEARILGDLRIFQAIHNDLKLKHEIVTTEDGRKVYAYTYDGIDPYELEDKAFPTFLTLIDKCTRDSTRTFREGYEKALSDSNQERVETLSAWIHDDYIEGEQLAKSINKKLGADELTEQKDGE